MPHDATIYGQNIPSVSVNQVSNEILAIRALPVVASGYQLGIAPELWNTNTNGADWLPYDHVE